MPEYSGLVSSRGTAILQDCLALILQQNQCQYLSSRVGIVRGRNWIVKQMNLMLQGLTRPRMTVVDMN